ncbi:NAD(P)-binding domain-containing protein [Nocardioides sp. YIM 152588]|uniref:NAD(P)-binding domain-containing protein n=1 Tax=Nocardioides sp. YIM 152588 TaxID=3158259 RepID=UPI0032E3FDD0
MTTTTTDAAADLPTGRPRAGVIGLGMIGAGVAVSLAASGAPAAAVHDVRPDAADGLEGVPALSATPGDVARVSDVVVLAVVTADQAREVLEGERGVLAAARPGLVVVLLSTVSLAAVRDLGELCARHEVSLLDAGVTNGTSAAKKGLVTMVGGPDEAVGRAMPVLEGFSKAVVHCGASGTGMVAKLARNLTTYAQWAAVREATSLAAAGGVAPEKLLEVLRQGNGGVGPLLHLDLLAQGWQVPADQVESAAGLAEKDLAAAQELAGELGVEVPLADVTRPRVRPVYEGSLEEPLPDEPRARGLAMMDRVYGDGYSANVTEPSLASPSVEQTVDHLFAEVWGRGRLTVRDRRLVTLGLTAMLGRADLLEVQLRGAVAAGELTDDQLRELALHLHHYAGWPNGTNAMAATEKLIALRAAGRL